MRRHLSLLLALTLAALPTQAQVIIGGGAGAVSAPSVSASGYANAPTSSLTEVSLANVKIPGGSLGANGYLEIQGVYTFPNNANTKTFSIRWGATQGMVTGGINQAGAATTVASGQFQLIIHNSNATNAQNAYLGQSFGGGAIAAIQTSAIDTTADTWVNFNGLVGVGTDAITLQAWSVRAWKN